MSDPIAALVKQFTKRANWAAGDTRPRDFYPQDAFYECAQALKAALRADADANPGAPSGMVSVEPGLYTSADVQPPQELQALYWWCGITFATYDEIEIDGDMKVVCRLCAKGKGEPHGSGCSVGVFESALKNAAGVPRRAEPSHESITIVGTCREGSPHFCANCGNAFTALRAEPLKET